MVLEKSNDNIAELNDGMQKLNDNIAETKLWYCRNWIIILQKINDDIVEFIS